MNRTLSFFQRLCSGDSTMQGRGVSRSGNVNILMRFLKYIPDLTINYHFDDFVLQNIILTIRQFMSLFCHILKIKNLHN